MEKAEACPLLSTAAECNSVSWFSAATHHPVVYLSVYHICMQITSLLPF